MRANTVLARHVVVNGQAWQPAVDMNGVMIGDQIVAVIALLTLRAVIRNLVKW